MKKIIVGLLVLLVLIGFGFFYLFTQLDSLVDAAIEKYGSQVTGTTVDVGNVELELSKGFGAIRQLQISNPSGFKSAYAVRLNDIDVEMDLQKFSKQLVVIKEVVIDGPSVIVELRKGGSNIDVIKRSIESYSGGGSQTGSDQVSPKLIIENLIVKNGELQLSSPMASSKVVTTSIPAIHLRDIGKGEGGATASQVAKIVLAEVIDKAQAAASKLDLSSIDAEQIKDLSAKELQKLKDLGGGTGEKLKNLF